MPPKIQRSTKARLADATVPGGLFDCFASQPSRLMAPIDSARLPLDAASFNWSLRDAPPLLVEGAKGQSWEILGSDLNGGIALVGLPSIVDVAWERFSKNLSARLSIQTYFEDDLPFAARWELPSGESMAIFYHDPEADELPWAPPEQVSGWMCAPFGVIANDQQLHELLLPLVSPQLAGFGMSIDGLDPSSSSGMPFSLTAPFSRPRADCFGSQATIAEMRDLSWRAMEAICCDIMGWRDRPCLDDIAWPKALAQAMWALREADALDASTLSGNSLARRPKARI